ncbi:unnamed protein product [Blepharisma stoltei]|uniref:Uncharacterized protein n=1 Tax=Blepharisma stoltei TaxID=1481888 RepID=A0AAU9JSH9_9CILI|nr:unnamed protein product [Blepharisma stoltei]
MKLLINKILIRDFKSEIKNFSISFLKHFDVFQELTIFFTKMSSLRSSRESKNKEKFFESKYKVDKFSRQGSNDRLNDFKQKLELSFKSQKSSQSNWKAFRSEIKPKPIASSSLIPSLSHYQDISHFRPTTPTSPKPGSPLFRIKPQIDEFFRGLNASRSTSPIIVSPKARSPWVNLNLNKKSLQEALRIENLRKGIEILEEMNDQDFRRLPSSYTQDLSKFCRKALNKVKGFDF